MTERQWLVCVDPDAMLGYLGARVGDRARRVWAWLTRGARPGHNRRLRRFSCACCRLIWPLLGDERSRGAVEVGERDAEGLADDGELVRARAEAWAAAPRLGAAGWAAAAALEPGWAAAGAAGWAAAAAGAARADHREAQCVLLRDLFGNPFRPISFNPSWRTADVLRLAKSIHAERAFDHLPILADLLEEAGATDAALLAHLRGPGPHSLGCHALGAALGKE